MPTSRRILAFLVQPAPLTLMLLALVLETMAERVLRWIADPDPWWVAAAGREMLATGRLPRTNLFSFTDPQVPWIMHEWLVAPLYALGLERWGPSFFVALSVVVYSAGFALVLAATAGRVRNLSFGLVTCMVLVSCLSQPWLVPRPTSIGLLFPVAMTLIAFAPRFR